MKLMELLKNSMLIDTVETVVIGLAIFVVIYLFIMQPNRVDGESMSPTLHTDDYILTEKVSYRMRLPQRGEIIVVYSPVDKNTKKELVKRVIALPNEMIRISEGNVYITPTDEQQEYKLDEGYLTSDSTTKADKQISEGITYHVQANELIVMGDNRTHSSDSRSFGPIKRADIVGRAALRYWPLSKFGFLSR